MPYGDEAGIVSVKSANGIAKMMATIVGVFEASGLTVSEKKMETMLLLPTPNQALPTSHLVVEAAG